MPATAVIQDGLSLTEKAHELGDVMHGRAKPGVFQPAILTAACEALEWNHVEAGEVIRSLCDLRQRMAVTQ